MTNKQLETYYFTMAELLDNYNGIFKSRFTKTVDAIRMELKHKHYNDNKNRRKQESLGKILRLL